MPHHKTTSGLGMDGDPQTRLERNLDKDWAEIIHYAPTEQLSSGDSVYFRDHAAKAHKRWKSGIIIQCKEDYEYRTGFHRSHGFDIYKHTYTSIQKLKQNLSELQWTT